MKAFLATRTCGRALLVVLALAASSCGVLKFAGALPPGTSIAEARQSLGGPTGQYPLPDGGTRLEFAQGGFGRQTYMLDFDPGGHLVSTQQVLTPSTFTTIRPGMTQLDVLSRIGRPVSVFPIGWQKLNVWNYRFGGLDGDCVLFQVSIAQATGLVTETGQGYDSACDGPNTRD